jgi:hypothetical protein
MKLTQLRIHNVLGIEHLEVSPGAVTRVHGPNGAGKSSVIKAIQGVCRGGKQLQLVRQGVENEPSEVFLLIEHEAGNIAISKRLGEKAKLSVSIDGVDQREPQSFVNLLFDALSVNPVDFLKAKPGEQVKWLLSAMPLTVTAADFNQAGIDVSGWAIPEGVHGLLVIEQAREWIYDRRHGENQRRSRAKQTAERLRESLPSGTDAEIRAERAELAALRDGINGDLSAYQANKRANLESGIRSVTEMAAAAREEVLRGRRRAEEVVEGKRTAVDEARRKLTEAEAALRESQSALRQFDEKLTAVDSVLAQEIREIKAGAAAATDTEKQLVQGLTEVDRNIALVDQRLAAFQKATGLLEEYTRACADEASAGEEHARLESAMGRLEQMKRSLLTTLAIPDVEIRGDEIYYQGHPLETQNEATRVILALQVVAARIKIPITLQDGTTIQRLPLVCLDGAECLDVATYSCIDQFAAAEHIQLIVTRVTDDPKLEVSVAD